MANLQNNPTKAKTQDETCPTFIDILKQIEVLEWLYNPENGSLYIAYLRQSLSKQVTLNYKQIEKYFVESGLCDDMRGSTIYFDDSKNELYYYFKEDFTDAFAKHLVAHLESKQAINKLVADTVFAANKKYSDKLNALK